MSEKSITSSKRRDSGSSADTTPFSNETTVGPKEGGFQAWSTVAGSFLVYYASFGLINSFGFFQDYYKRDYLVSTPPMTIAFIGTLQIMLMNILATISGALYDSYGIKVRVHACFHLRFY